MANTEPRVTAGRPKVPQDYGVPENNDTLLPWSYVDEHMTAARNFWIVTASPESQPAASPVWGAWLAGKLYFDGSPVTRRGRNIRANPRMAVHLESGDQVLILEGRGQVLESAPERSLAERVAAEYTRKYRADGYSPAPDQWDQGGLFIFSPRVVMAWTKFPDDMTRWQIEAD